jgi:hypothetical protein
MPSTLAERLAEVRAEAQQIQDTADEAGRPKTDEEQSTFDAKIAEAQTIRSAIEGQKAAREFLDDLDGIDDEVDDNTFGGSRPTPYNGREPRDPGGRVVGSEQFKAMMAQFPDGHVPKGANPTMGAVKLGKFSDTLLTDPALYPVPHKLAPAELSVIDLFEHLNVIEDSPKTVQIDRETFTNNAAAHTEGSDTAKAESELVYTPEEVTLATLAHHIPVTTQALKYNSILRSRINNRLINGVRAKAQADVASTLVASTGLMQQQGFDTDLATTIRKAVTKAMRGIMAIGGNTNVKVLISPEDHETLDLELLDAMVAMAGQDLAQTSTIWRSTVVPVYGLTEGVCFVGDSKQVDFYVGADGVTVSTGWVDKQFIQNRITFLAEMDAKAAVIGGAALVKTDLDGVTEPNFS